MGDLPPEVKKQLEQLLSAQAGGKRRKSKKASKKTSAKKTSKKNSKQKGGKGANPAMQAGINFRAFLADNAKLKQGVPMVKLVSYLVNKIKEKKPNLGYIEAIDEAKKYYMANKAEVVKKYNEITEKKMSRSKGSKKTSKKASKKTSKKH